MCSFLRSFLAASLLGALLHAPLALAQGGVNLAWNNCPAEGGTANLDFACGSNAGIQSAVASFVLPADAPRVVGIYAVIDVYGTVKPGACDGPGCPPLEALPPWWQLQSGGCRYGSLTYTTDFTVTPFDAATRCFDVWRANAIGGLDYGFALGGNAGHARFRVVAAVPSSQQKSLVAGREYYGFRMRVNNARSTGDGSCGGCTSPVSLVLSLLQIAQPAGVGDFNLTAPIGQNFVTWQRSQSPLDVTPAARRSWGQIKSLYR